MYKNYNLSFGSPAVDTYSKCVQLLTKLQSGDQTVEPEYNLHKKRSNCFFEQLQSQKIEIKLSIDCDKNVVLPKIWDN